jgi:hypothetical protein
LKINSCPFAQECPTPADQYYQNRNPGAYLSGTQIPSAGYLRIKVSPDKVKVQYVRSWLPADENVTYNRVQGRVE